MDKRGSTTPHTTEATDPIDRAVTELIRRLIEDDDQPDQLTGAEEVVLDIEIRGVRYLTVRFRAPPRSDPDATTPRPASTALATLSPREAEVARMVAKGYANKTIASVLDISSWTVSSHLRRIFAKFGVTSRAAMVARLLDDGRALDASPPSPDAHGTPPGPGTLAVGPSPRAVATGTRSRTGRQPSSS